MATASEIQIRITEAETALHALATGARVADVWRDGRRVTYTAASMQDLRDYISLLKSDLASAQTAEGMTVTRRRRPIGLAWRN